MTRNLALAWLSALLLFAIWPGLDLWASGLFFDAGSGRFPLAHSGGLEVVRNLIWNAANLAALGVLVMGCHALLSPRPTAVPGRIWGYLLALVLLGPLLLVNGILKEHWGRARPADTDAFGGALPFSGPWEIAGHCATNCSFVSGEAAAVTVLAVILGVVFWHNVQNKRRLLIALAALILLGASLRVLKGRHYLSDVVWSVLMILALAHVLAQRIGVYAVAHRVTWAALRTDMARIRAALFKGRSP